jgi:hypothetical protein
MVEVRSGKLTAIDGGAVSCWCLLNPSRGWAATRTAGAMRIQENVTARYGTPGIMDRKSLDSYSVD